MREFFKCLSIVAAVIILSSLVSCGGSGGSSGTSPPPAAAKDPLDAWHWRNPLPQGNSLNDVSFLNGLFSP